MAQFIAVAKCFEAFTVELFGQNKTAKRYLVCTPTNSNSMGIVAATENIKLALESCIMKQK